MVAVTNIQTILSLAEAVTGWSGTSGQLDTEVFKQGAGAYTYQTGKSSLEACTFTPAANINMTATYTVPHLYWTMKCDVFTFCELLNTGATNSGLMVRVTDGAGNWTQWHVAGSDTWDGAWGNFVLDLTNTTKIHSSSGTLSLADVDIITWYTDNSNSGNIRIIDNTWLDACRYGEGLQAESTTTEVFKFLDIATDDSLTANWYGVFQKESGILACLGGIIAGDDVSTANTYLTSSNEQIVFQNHIVHADHYRIKGVGNATGTTNLHITGAVWSSDELTGPDVDFADINITSLIFQGTMLNMGSFLYQTGGVCDAITYVNCNQITPAGASIVGSTISGYEGTVDTGAIVYNETADPDGEFDFLEITKGTAATHAIEFGLSAPLDITLRDCDFDLYNAANANSDSTFLVRRTTGTVTINIVDGSGNVSYKSLGATVNIVLNPVTTKITVKNIATSALIESARVLLYVTDASNFIWNQAVTSITHTASLATVNHTAHGLTTGNKIKVTGCTDNLYNGIKIITVTTVNAYTYALVGSPISPAAGTPLVTMVIIEGLTDINGEISDTRSYTSDQPITGKVRQASAGTDKYITQPINETISNSTGLLVTAQLVPDE